MITTIPNAVVGDHGKSRLCSRAKIRPTPKFMSTLKAKVKNGDYAHLYHDSKGHQAVEIAIGKGYVYAIIDPDDKFIVTVLTKKMARKDIRNWRRWRGAPVIDKQQRRWRRLRSKM